MKQRRRLFFIIVSLFFSTALYAQIDSAKAAKVKVELTDSICASLSDKDIDNVKNVQDLQGLFIKSFSSGNVAGLLMDYVKYSGMDFSNMEQMQGFAQDIVVGCPKLISVFMKLSNSPEFKNEMEKSDSTIKIQSN